MLWSPGLAVISNRHAYSSNKGAPLFVSCPLFDGMLNSNRLFVFGKEVRSIQPPQCPWQLPDRLA